jgi:hypothetical protein
MKIHRRWYAPPRQNGLPDAFLSGKQEIKLVQKENRPCIFKAMIDNGEVFLESESVASAIQFINSTACHVFLTGKAGTGKTTFLKNLQGRVHKQLAIVAPTGIAALNAGGVTLHSQFLLPFGMFVPDREMPPSDISCYTPRALAQKHPLNSQRKQILRSIDLLIIDEVSMLRADLLDAIDYRLKSARGNFTQSFGGVQLLLIGDLFQLPPVVKRDEESQLKKYYNSPWFFESKALRHDGFVYIELDRIFRQNDIRFINLLNNLRNNQPSREDIDELNKHYRSPGEIQELKEVITLTTHNFKADELNARALHALPSPPHTIHATIEGDFPENMFPVLQHLELKVGAQVMFTRNDSEGKMYFNGKLATVTSIAGDEVQVELADSHIPYTLRKSIWENKRYTVDTMTQDIEDEVIGTFEQYPVKLAWAITVHKSQGLTFERAIIDVGQAFADGQVYVALSRLRSLDGLIMRTRIDPHVISTDKHIVAFSCDHNRPDRLYETMKAKQSAYIQQLIYTTFDFDAIVKECVQVQRQSKESIVLTDSEIEPVVEEVIRELVKEKGNTSRFRHQLHALLQEGNKDLFAERLKKGSAYYKQLLYAQLKTLLGHIENMRYMKRVKTYLTNLVDLEQYVYKKIEEVDKALYLTESILDGRMEFDFSQLTSERVAMRTSIIAEVKQKARPPVEKNRKKKRRDEESTYDHTLRLLRAGMTVPEIAKERELTVGTIEGHLAKAVESGIIGIDMLLKPDEVASISDAIREMPEGYSLKDLFARLGGKFRFGQLRAVVNHVHWSERLV